MSAPAKGASSIPRYILVLAGFGAVVLAACAIPAFSADGGTITATVATPAAACIQLSSTTLDYGTQPFAANGSDSRGFASGITFTNCSSAASTFAMSGTDASGPGGSWALTDEWSTCDGSLNRYGLFEYELPENYSGQYLTTAPRTLIHRRPPTDDPVDTFAAGESETLGFIIDMPCVGSNGAGQTYAFSIGLTATVA